MTTSNDFGDLISRARVFAVTAHESVGHLRKYTFQPYAVHLKEVARIVSSVSADPETVAAAWLHDVVEDTPVTIDDIRAAFGEEVAKLVAQLTNISRPSDGNRRARATVDRQHLSSACARAQTIKLADLIHNSRDISKHDQAFARIYLAEMEALLEVLREGDASLLQQARQTWQSCKEIIGKNRRCKPLAEHEPRAVSMAQLLFQDRKLLRIFSETFAAQDIAEPLMSYDQGQLEQFLGGPEAVCGVRDGGSTVGFIEKEELSEARAEHDKPGEGPPEQALTENDTSVHGSSVNYLIRKFTSSQVVAAEQGLPDMAQVLLRHRSCFVESLGQVNGVITRTDMQKPVVRMWLFGMVTLFELLWSERIQQIFPGESWLKLLSAGRLAKALELQEERARRGRNPKLLDCLQLSDKGQLLAEDSLLLEIMGAKSGKQWRKVVQSMEVLRNNLAHNQDIISEDWPVVAGVLRGVGEIAAACRW